MNARNRRHDHKAALELVEEAIHLLRLSSGPALACYYLGTLPFVLDGLYFWADMSRSPFADKHLAASSLGLALLFLWMKFWQTVFISHVRARLTAAPPPRWDARRCLRVFLIQAALQPSSAIFLTAAGTIMLPFGWVYAFYQNVTVLGDGDTPEALAVLKKSWKQCVLWPGQNHSLLGLLTALGFVLFLNLTIVCLALPSLLKTLLGIDSVYAQSPESMLNTTFLAAMFGLAWLCLDPVVKTVYALRCFYGQSITTGEDLKSELKGFVAAGRPATALALIITGLLFAPNLNAAEPSPAAPPPTPSRVAPQDLDHAINDVIHQSKYTWRMPREGAKDDQKDRGWIGQFFDDINTRMKEWTRAMAEWLDRMLQKLRWRRTISPNGSSSIDWATAIKHLLILLVVIVLLGLGYLLFRTWRRSSRGPALAIGEVVAAPPDLSDENVGAEQLPEDGWIKLGRELLERGDFRLALRAFYFASLAHLAARGLITVAKFKSNRDYERELNRRGHSLPELLASFGRQVLVFDRSWYGMHDVDRELLEEYIANLERIKAV